MLQLLIPLGILILIITLGITIAMKDNAQFKFHFLKLPLYLASGFFIASGLIAQGIFYAEPGYIYHVRTVLGEEKVVVEPGYKFYPFGRYNAWKRAMTVQALGSQTNASMQAESESTATSASLAALNIMFLDQVDAHAEATARFSIPSDEESFLQLAHEYRTPDNLLRTALIPAFKETLQATASLMSAENYYSGGRTEFNSEFEMQMTNGVYIVRREETVVKVNSRAKSTANAALGKDQQDYGDEIKTELLYAKCSMKTDSPHAKHKSLLILA